jgi:hypothetical protein
LRELHFADRTFAFTSDIPDVANDVPATGHCRRVGLFDGAIYYGG